MNTQLLNVLFLIALSAPVVLTIFLMTFPGRGRVERLLPVVYLTGSALSLAGGILAAVTGVHAVRPGPFIGDFTSMMVLASVLLIAGVIAAYSRRYILTAGSRASFLTSISCLVCASALLSVSDDLLLTGLCWSSISFLLWHCLVRMGKPDSARTVLKHHLLSDLMLVAGFTLVFFSSGTTSLTELTSTGSSPMSLSGVEPVAAALIVLSMCVKSALFPFHRWLLATLDAPTPLSGLLHAGLVNVSAILAYRIYPILEPNAAVITAWGILAFVSAAVGTFSMSGQFDVKRKLVYSTVGQMGFMALQCACGAVGAAVLHMIAHGLFKCHMFLQSGTSVSEGTVKKQWSGLPSRKSYPVVATVLLSIALLPFSIFLWSSDLASAATVTVASLALVAALWSYSSVSRVGFRHVLPAALALGAALAASGSLMASFENASASSSHLAAPFMIAVFALACIGFLKEIAGRSELGRAVYVQCLNGFYIDELAFAAGNLKSGNRGDK